MFLAPRDNARWACPLLPYSQLPASLTLCTVAYHKLGLYTGTSQHAGGTSSAIL